MFDYKGAFHIHSNYSFDGKVSVENIIKSAKKCGLDFVVITDHFNLDAKINNWSGWQDGILVIVGEEISPRHNHYLALGIKEPIIVSGDYDNPQFYIDKVNSEAGVGMIAHPDHTGAPLFGVKDYKWTDWNVHGFNGISVWDLMTDFQETLTSLPRALLNYYFPSFALQGPKQATLQRWDELNKTHKVFGYGEIDNHDSLKKYYGFNFRIFPFDYAFKTIRTHILLKQDLSKDSVVAEKQVLNALRSSRAYVSLDRFCTPEKFEFKIYGKNETAGIGEEIKFEKEPLLCEVIVPKKAKINIFHNGENIFEIENKKAIIEIRNKGVYRAEVKNKVLGRYTPWIYSNHIFVY